MIERLLDLIDAKIAETGTTDYAISKELGIGSGIIGKWRTGKTKPSVGAIIKLAKYLNVSTDYILTGKEHPVSKDDEELLALYHQLSQENKRDILGVMRVYASVHSSSSEE